MRALITGASGLLGRELAAILPGAVSLDHEHLDIADEDSVWRAFTSKQADVVFHCAAMTDVDGCERDPARAWRVNALGSRNVAGVCCSLRLFLVALSTDYVFDGRLGKDIPEDAKPNPLSVYGKTKLEGEAAIQDLCPNHAIVRTSWLYGAHRGNFVERVLSKGFRGQSMPVVNTQVSSPTWAKDLAPALVETARKHATGVFHLTNEGHTARDDWARAILEAARLDSQLIESVESFPAPAKRPRYSALANVRGRGLGIRLEPWQDALDTFVSSDPVTRDLPATATETVA